MSRLHRLFAIVATAAMMTIGLASVASASDPVTAPAPTYVEATCDHPGLLSIPPDTDDYKYVVWGPHGSDRDDVSTPGRYTVTALYKTFSFPGVPDAFYFGSFDVKAQYTEACPGPVASFPKVRLTATKKGTVRLDFDNTKSNISRSFQTEVTKNKVTTSWSSRTIKPGNRLVIVLTHVKPGTRYTVTVPGDRGAPDLNPVTVKVPAR